jgi:hypothetical protein
MTVVYWQRIQNDWETTGEALGRLQQAVTDIPAALETNLKAIATRLSEGQAQALAKLQGEVNEGARATLEKGALQIGDSLAANLSAPLQSMQTMLAEFSRRAESQGERLAELAGRTGEDARQSVAQGAELVAGSLERNFKQPLAALEGKLLAWTQYAEAQSESIRGLGEDLRRVQSEAAEQARRLAGELTQEIRSALAAQADQAGRLLAGFSDRAGQVQADAETRLSALQSSLLAEVASRLQAAQAAHHEAQQAVLEKALKGVEAQAGAAQAAAAGQIQALRAAAEGQVESLRSALGEHSRTVQSLSEAQVASLETAVEAFTRGLAEVKDASLETVRAVEAKASAGLEAQSRLGQDVASQVSALAERMHQGSADVAELAQVAQINQAEMQAGVAMLNTGLSSILERLEKQAEAGDGYQSLLGELGKILSDFQDRAAEVLVENAMKTQEILMEVLRGVEGRASSADNALTATAG